MSQSAENPGAATAGAITVAERGAPAPLSGPGTGRGPGAPAASRAERFASFDVADFPVPDGTEEDWRFTPLDRLHGLHDGSAVPDGKVLVEVAAPAGVRVETVGRDDDRLGRAGVPDDRIAAQAYSAFSQATVVSVPAQQVVAEPITVTLRGEGGGAAYGHTVIELGALAEAVVVLDHGGDAVYADNVEFLVGEGASLTVVSLQDWSRSATHVSRHAARLARDARFKSVAVTFGGDLVRIFPQVRYDGPGGDAELLGLYFADAGQHLEHRLFVDHAVPHCRSRVAYKGALQGDEAHVVWIGDVLIRAAAEGTDTYELNRNLVLSDGARADSVPNLEIETGEVAGAGHASATGRFDDEQLFYLCSRGIPAAEARRLVVRGFFAEVIAQIGIPAIAERLTAAVEAELEASS